jgi:hypothetical protein
MSTGNARRVVIGCRAARVRLGDNGQDCVNSKIWGCKSAIAQPPPMPESKRFSKLQGLSTTPAAIVAGARIRFCEMSRVHQQKGFAKISWVFHVLPPRRTW